jgi:glucosamine--fructose-6-phosphate aminotransferase (isomerizing)
LNDSLMVQSARAAEFIHASWPDVRDRAQEVRHQVGDKFRYVIICGCGDSHHAALNLELAFGHWSEYRPRSTSAMFASRYLVPTFAEHPDSCLLICISVSGEVARTIEAVEVGRTLGMRSLALTGAPESSLADAAHAVLSLATPDTPFGPGLLSYLASILAGLAVVDALSPEPSRTVLRSVIEELPGVLRKWQEVQVEQGVHFAENAPDLPIVFLGSGPAFGSALFSAAKVIEATGRSAWGQDVEEWAHLEYFCDPAPMPTWLLSGRGRSHSREAEVADAAQIIGRRFMVSDFQGGEGWSEAAREAVSPLCLWAGPTAYASRRAALIDEEAFRGFGGGRSQDEGGGASRIRTSQRVVP